jgi:hypothetical protein
MTLADMLDGYEAGRVSQRDVLRWLGGWRYAEFLAILDYNLRPLPRGRLPFATLTASGDGDAAAAGAPSIAL